MNKFFGLCERVATSKPVVALAGMAASASVFAEGEQVANDVSATLLTSYITSGKAEVVAVLTAGAAIVGAFFIWGLIKKALNRSK